MLTFFLIGINKADLYELESIDNGYITYRRNKTGRIISVKVEPEAAEIIERLRVDGQAFTENRLVGRVR